MLTIVTFNTHFGRKVGKIAKIFETHSNLKKADVIFFQEIESHTKEGKARAEQIAERLGFYCLYAPARVLPKGGTHGIAILSKYPLLSHEVVPLPFIKSAYRSRTRIAQIAEILINKRRVTLANVHLDVRVNVRQRVLQVAPVLEQVFLRKNKYIIVAGDFNTTPFVWFKGAIPMAVQSQKEHFALFMKELGFSGSSKKAGYSIRAGLLRLYLDAVFVKNMKIVEVSTEPKIRVSDHKRLWAKITF